MVEGLTGLTVPPGDPEALASALLQILGERDAAKELEPLLAPFPGWHAVYQGPLFHHGPVSRALARMTPAASTSARLP